MISNRSSDDLTPQLIFDVKTNFFNCSVFSCDIWNSNAYLNLKQTNFIHYFLRTTYKFLTHHNYNHTMIDNLKT